MSLRWAWWPALLPLAACSLQPVYERPALPVPASFPSGGAYPAASAPLAAVHYQDVFRDARLQSLIMQALSNNRDLRIAAANIVQARALYRVQRAGLFPEVGVSSGISRVGSGSAGRASSVGSTTGTAPTGTTPTGTTSTGTSTTGTASGRTAYTSYSADVGINAFEIDLFGRVRSLSDAALNRYFATDAAAQATRLTLVGDIADAWLTYASDQSLLAIAQRTEASAGKSVELTRRRLQGGVAPRTDLRQAELVLSTAQSDLARLQTALVQDVNAMQLLVGAPVDPALLPDSIETAGSTLVAMPAGLDSTVLLRRPDVAEAEYNLRAANADIGEARAELFPRVSLTAVVGFASGTLGSLFSHDAFNYQVGPGISYPIFRAGAGQANVLATQAQRDALLATYERAIQTAFRDVADALARRGTIDAQFASDQRLVEASEDNARLSDARYRTGVDNFLQSLDAQRSLYTAQRTLVQTELTRASNRVALYRALGGDALVDVGEPKATPH